MLMTADSDRLVLPLPGMLSGLRGGTWGRKLPCVQCVTRRVDLGCDIARCTEVCDWFWELVGGTTMMVARYERWLLELLQVLILLDAWPCPMGFRTCNKSNAGARVI